MYAEKEHTYLAVARNCSIGNKHAIQAPHSLFPVALENVAKSRFGYVLGIGTHHETECWAYHGYADLDPTIDNKKLGGLEVFDMIKNEAASSTRSAPKVGTISRVKNMADFNNELAKATNKGALPQISPICFKYSNLDCC